MKRKIAYYLLLGMFGMLLLTGCQSQGKSNPSKQNSFEITTTFYPMYYFTKEIVQNKASVKMLTPSNTEPHDYEPSAKDISQIEKSHLFIYNADDLETWVPSVKSVIQTDSSVKMIKASQGISLLKDEEHGNDPHVWLDPVLAKKEVKTIAKAIIKADPKHQAFYRKNERKLLQRLEQLNKEYRTMTQHAKHKTFVTQHAAFSYLAHQYGLTQEAISGIDPEQEPSPKQLAQIEQKVKKQGIRYIYVEEQASSKVAQTVKNATGATLLPLNTLESLSYKEQKEGQNYFTVMNQNLKSLQKSLQ